MAKNSSPTIKDEKRYKALRREGASKEKAARIANTPKSEAGKRGGKARKYEKMSYEELYTRARKIGIEGRSSMKKDKLIHALRYH